MKTSVRMSKMTANNLAVPGNLLEMGILGPHSTLTEQNCQWVPAICAFKMPAG